jgi:hypothetical protein
VLEVQILLNADDHHPVILDHHPLATDPISQGDDHLRLIKSVLQAQFSGLSGTTAVTADGAEMNLLDGCTATTTELNYLDITTLGTSEASKVVTADANGDVTIADGAYDFDIASHDGTNGLLLGGTLVTATATELNLIDGYTGTTAEVTALDASAVPCVVTSRVFNSAVVPVYPSIKFNSVAVAVTKVPPSNNPFVPS